MHRDGLSSPPATFDRRKAHERAVRATEGRPSEQWISLNNLGRTLLALGEWSNAERVIRRSLDLDCKQANTWQLLGQTLFQRGERQGAQKAIRRALSLAVGDPEVLASCQSDLATILVAARRKQEAARVLEQALEMAKPGQARARMLTNLGALSWRLGKKEQAESLLSRALAEMEEAVGPRHLDVARVLEDYAVVLAKTGRKAEARAASERAHDLKTTFSFQANTGRGTVSWLDIK